MTVSERLVIELGDGVLFGQRQSGDGPTLLLLHAGVTDRRSWQAVAEGLAGEATIVSYDRRGFGQTPATPRPFSHIQDLLGVINAVTDDPVWLVGSSAGGAIALEAALSAPDRVAGLVLLAPAVSGAPEPELDPATARFDRLIERVIDEGNLDERNRLETWLWLDGPSQAERRVGDPARGLMLDMNAIILRNRRPETAGASGIDAWGQIERIGMPATVACGNLDVPCLARQSRQLADRLPAGRFRELRGVAHLPQLEQPSLVVELVRETLTAP